MSKQKLLQLFALESQETLQQMEDALLQLENTPADKETINVVFRAVHTAKGSAGVVGLEVVSAFAHNIENVLDKARSGKLKITPEMIRLLLNCRDHLGHLISAYTESDSEFDKQALDQHSEELVTQLQAIQKTTAPPAATAAEAPKAVADAQSPATPAPAAPALQKPSKLQNIFLMESRDILGRINNELNVLENRPQSTDALNNLFMSIHTIKGSSGLVKADHVAKFSQACEGFLQQFRNGTHATDARFHELMTQCSQYMEQLLDELSSGQVQATLHTDIEQFVSHLKAYPQVSAAVTPAPTPVPSAPPQVSAPPPVSPPPPTPVPVEADTAEVVRLDNAVEGDQQWHISLRFHAGAMCNGIEPMATLQHLKTIGHIVHLNTLFDAMPVASQMNPEHCYLGFEIEFQSSATKAEIESVFELVHNDCDVRILPPHSQASAYIALIQELPEDTEKLGDMLIESGTLTRRELDTGLNLQQAPAAEGDEQSLAVPEQASRKIGEILVNEGMVQQDVVNAALNKQQQIRDSKSRVQKNIQVNAEKLDQLINLVGELVITNAGMNLLLQGMTDADGLRENASLMSRLVEDIRNSTLSMRMVQISSTFSRFRRLVHDLSQDLDKKIELSISGAETELDKSMVEKITDPLTHLVRNAIDHGIESAQERLASDKSDMGSVYLHAYHDSGSIVIEVGDDGKGLDLQKILDKAVNQGLVSAEQNLTEEEVLRLIFEPGISTAERVTQLSGRGVGLDVVKRDINALNGTVDVISEQGQGTTFQIYLPLTLAIIDGFLLSVGHSSFVIPLDRVVECVAYKAAEQNIEQGYLSLRGKVLPLLHIHSLFGIDLDESRSAQSEDKHRANIVVVHYGNQEAGLVVDALLGELQAVIKPLGRMFENLPGVSGATILGNGEVALILDVPALVQRYAHKERHSSRSNTVQNTALQPTH